MARVPLEYTNSKRWPCEELGSDSKLKGSTRMSHQLEVLREHAARLETRVKKIREQGQAVAHRGIGAVATVAGGATAGLIESYMPTIPSTQIETDMALGGLLTAVGVFGLVGGDVDKAITDYGAGMLAVATARGLKKALGKA